MFNLDPIGLEGGGEAHLRREFTKYLICDQLNQLYQFISCSYAPAVTRRSWATLKVIRPAVRLRGDIFGSCALRCVAIAVFPQCVMIVDSWE